MKKLLYTITLFLLFISIIQADELSELDLIWKVSYDTYNRSFAFSNNEIFEYNNNILTIYDKKSGKSKSIEFETNILDIKEYNGNYYIGTQKYIYKYDKNLKKVKSRKDYNSYEYFSYFEIDYDTNELKVYDRREKNVFIMDENLNIKTELHEQNGNFIVVNTGSVRLFNEEEKEINKITCDTNNYYFKRVIKYNDNYYILLNEDTNEYYWHYKDSFISKVIVTDLSLNIIKEQSYDSTTKYLDDLHVIDDKVYGATYNGYLYEINENLEISEVNIKLQSNPYDINKELFAVSSYLENDLYSSEESKYFIEMKNENEEIIKTRKNSELGYLILTKNESDKNYYKLYYYNKLKELQFSKEYAYELENTKIDISFFEDNIVIFDSTNKNNLIFYDNSGKELRKIEIENSIDFEEVMLIGQDNGLTIINQTNANTKEIRDGKAMLITYKYELLHYNYNPHIFTKAIGNGNIKVLEENIKGGNEITFIVTPEEGYVLGKVKVTDEKGNTIVFTDNTFTMPNMNVLIEATFEPYNPETSDIAIILCIAIILSGVTITYLNVRKMSELV